MNQPGHDAANSAYTFYLVPCQLRGQVLVKSGKRFPISLREAITKFAKSSDPRTNANILRARRGHYLGIRKKGDRLENFLIVNPTQDGSISWLLKKVPDLEHNIIEVYLVDEVQRPYSAVDLPGAGVAV